MAFGESPIGMDARRWINGRRGNGIIQSGRILRAIFSLSFPTGLLLVGVSKTFTTACSKLGSNAPKKNVVNEAVSLNCVVSGSARQNVGDQQCPQEGVERTNTIRARAQLG